MKLKSFMQSMEEIYKSLPKDKRDVYKVFVSIDSEATGVVITDWKDSDEVWVIGKEVLEEDEAVKRELDDLLNISRGEPQVQGSDSAAAA